MSRSSDASNPLPHSKRGKLRPSLLLSLATTFCTACLGGDQAFSVVQVFTPRSEVWIAFGARGPGEATDRVSLEWGAVGEPPAGFVYEAWLVSDGGARLMLGRFRTLVDTLVVPADSGNDILAIYSQFDVTLEPRTGDDPSPSLEMLTHRAIVEQDARALLRTLLSDAADTPPDIGYTAGLVWQSRALLTQASLAAAATDIVEARSRLEHALNIIDGTAIDHDGDGTVENADSDGFGLLNYAEQTRRSAALVDGIANPWDDLLRSGADLALVSDSTTARIANARLVALAGVQSNDPTVVSERADTLSARAQLIVGIETATIDPACGQCGSLTAWRQAAAMTRIPLTAQQPFAF